jgi:outer membrane lipoprotein-sorting protein
VSVRRDAAKIGLAFHNDSSDNTFFLLRGGALLRSLRRTIMRKIVGVAGVVSVFALIIFSVRGGEEAKLREIIARAIKAHGGAENMEKFKASIAKTKGKLLGLEYTAETSIQQPDRSRTGAESKLGKFVQVLNGDKGWVKLGDLSRECSKEELAEMKEQLNATRISQLTALTEKEYKLSALGEEKIDDRPVIGVRVERKGFREVSLFFDKDNGLLLKMQTRMRDPLRGGEEFTAETLYGDYKNVEGLMTPHKFTIKYDGKVYNEGAITDVTFSEQLEDNIFEKP